MAKKKKMKPIKAIIALCEGKTDVAFLRRLLKTDGYSDYIEIVSQIPQPLGLGGNQQGESYFINKLKTYKYDSSKLRDRPLLPFILRRTHGQSDTFVLLYDMNGMNRTKNYREVIDDFNELANPFKVSTPKIDSAIAFIYDLDNKLTADRLQYIQDIYTDLIPELEYLSESKQITNSKNYKSVGYHFIKKEHEEIGDLEDIVLPLMKKGNESIFQNAEVFLNSDGGFSRYKETNPSEKDDNKTQNDLKKSLIGTVGQLAYSGLGNADIIKNTTMLNQDKFNNSAVCQDIIRFFGEMRKSL